MSDAPAVNLRFLFQYCNDVAAVRRFYVELLGMAEGAFMDEPEFGWFSAKSQGVELMWFRGDGPQPVVSEFAAQPGWQGGTLFTPSLGIHIPFAQFAETVKRLQDADVKLFAPQPDWRQDSYWGLSVLDPMGTTIEVYSAPPERPASTMWPGN